MKTKSGIGVVGMAAVIALIAFFFFETRATGQIRVSAPIPNAVVQSPLQVQGAARGSWYFEASFPVRLLDANGMVIAEEPATAQGDWMTDNFVPFDVELSFVTPTTDTGTLVFEKDNPSGLPQNAATLSVPVRFKR